MFAEYNEVAKTLAVFIGPLLVFAVAWAQLRKEMNKNNAPPTIGQPGLVAIGGALASQHATREYIQSQDDMAQAIRHLSKINQSAADELNNHHQELVKHMKRWGDVHERMLEHLEREAKLKARQDSGGD